MRRFDVFRNPNPKSQKAIPYVVVLQSELLDALGTQTIAPLVRPAILGRPGRRLNPAFEIEGETLYLFTQQLGAISTGSLKRHVTNLEAHRNAIIGALDFLFTGI